MKRVILSSILLAFLTSFALDASSQFAEERKIKNNEVVIEDQQMNLVVFDSETNENLRTDIIIRGLNARKPVVMNNVMDTVFEIKNYRLYTVSCIKEGYMYYNEKFWPDEVQVHYQKIELEPLKLGLKTNIRDIYFLGDQTGIYPKSKPAIEELMDWMENNKNVKISIIGHVNGPNNDRSERFYRKASLERAQSVVDYMIEEGMDPMRVDAKGAGNTEMIYPDPQTNWENEANRRIEIEITGL